VVFGLLLIGTAMATVWFTTGGIGDSRLTQLRQGTVEQRRTAADELGRVEAAEAAEIVEALVAALSDENERVRAGVVRAIGANLISHPTLTGAERAREGLRSALSDPSPEVRGAAAVALALQGQDTPAIFLALQDGLRSTDPVMRADADAALSSLDVSSPERLRQLFDLLRTGEEALRNPVLQALALVKPHESRTEAVAILVETLRDDSPLLRRAAAEVLKRSAPGDRSAVEPLAAALTDSEPTVRLAVAETLAAWSDQDAAVAALRQAIEDESREVRGAAAASLAACPEPPRAERLKALADTVSGEGSLAPLKQAIASAETDAIVRVIEGLKDPNASVRAAAAEALGLLAPRTPATVQACLALAQALSDDDRETRVAAARSLARFGKSARDLDGVVPALNQAAEHPDRPTSAHAIAALKVVNVPDER
jgi:HEAT repeat protein